MKNTAKFYIGIDISKDQLDYAILKGKTRMVQGKMSNTIESITAFTQQLYLTHGIKIKDCIFGLEHTGMYGNLLLKALNRAKATIVYENATTIRSSLGNLRGKTDPVDADRIARYLYKCREELKTWQPKRDIISEMAALSSLREKLCSIKNRLSVPLKEFKKFSDSKTYDELKHHCHSSLASLKANLLQLDRSIREIWQSDPMLKSKMELMMSVPAIGPQTALQILIKTNEFLDINDPRKFACFCGVAPFPYQSGSSVIRKSRISKMGDRKMKSLLHICAMGSLKSPTEFREYFERKTAEGKHGMLIINAIRFKIILRVFACIRDNRVYQKYYLPTRNE